MNTIKVLLLVENDEKEAAATQEKLQGADVPVTQLMIVRTLADAKAALKANEIDVVLLSLDLGNESRGMDTLAAIRPLYEGIIIVLTNLPNEAMGIAAIRMGAEDYLVKSKLTPERLRECLVFAQTRHTMKQASKRISVTLDLLTELATPKG